MELLLTRLTLAFILCFLGTSCVTIQNTTGQDAMEYLQQMVKTLESRMDSFEHVLETGHEDKYVVFYVRLSRTTTLNKNSIVKFNDAVINDGNHFNTGNGIFVAPVAGIYQFTWTTITYNANKVETELRVDNVVKGTNHILLNSGTNNIPATKVVICRVLLGEHVWIQTSRHYTYNSFYRAHDSMSSFTGMLIHKLKH